MHLDITSSLWFLGTIIYFLALQDVSGSSCYFVSYSCNQSLFQGLLIPFIGEQDWKPRSEY